MVTRRGCPPCFDSPEQYDAWRKAALYMLPGKSQYCADCTPEYQSRMIAERRCEHPGTLFGIDQEGGIRGTRPEVVEVIDNNELKK